MHTQHKYLHSDQTNGELAQILNYKTLATLQQDILLIFLQCTPFWQAISSGGSRNLERGVQLRVHEAHPKIFGWPRPLLDINAHVIIVATDW